MTKEKDIFDDVELDEFDLAELDTEDKVLYSKELRDLIRKEIVNGVSIAKRSIESEIIKATSEIERIKSSAVASKKEVDSSSSYIKKQLDDLKKEKEEFMEKMRKKYDNLKNEFLSFSGKQWFQFGGFSPQTNDLNIGPPAIEGAWRIVKSANGSDLEFQRYESGNWTVKGSFTP